MEGVMQEGIVARIVRALIAVAVLVGVALGGQTTRSAWTHADGQPASYVAQADTGGSDGPWDNNPFVG
jgi:hypothetical protein